jgi:hypothetical protein
MPPRKSVFQASKEEGGCHSQRAWIAQVDSGEGDNLGVDDAEDLKVRKQLVEVEV